jgi:integrase
VTENPVSRVPLLDEKKKTRATSYWKSTDEVDAYIRGMYAEGEPFGVGAEILCYGGCRIGELIAMRFGAVSESEHLISIRETWDRETRRVYSRTKGQGDGGEYAIPLLPRVLGAIRVLRNSTPYRRDSDFICHKPDGSLITYEVWHNAHHRVIERLGLPRITIHDLRRTFATLAGQHGISREQVQKILGHETAAVTQVYYRVDMEPIIRRALENGFGAQVSQSKWVLPVDSVG